MDGKKPDVKAWFNEGLDAIEDACRGMGVPVTIAAWGNAVAIASDPDKMEKSAYAKVLYSDVPAHRGYVIRQRSIHFPAHGIEVSGKRSEYMWVKDF